VWEEEEEEEEPEENPSGCLNIGTLIELQDPWIDSII